MDIIEIDCLEAEARERTVKAVHQAARRASARKGKEFRGDHRTGGTGAQAVTHDALREIDLGRVDHAGTGVIDGPDVSRTAARSARRHVFVPIPKGSTWMPVRPRGRVSSSAGIAGPLTRRKRRWLVGVMTLAFQGYAIATTSASLNRI